MSSVLKNYTILGILLFVSPALLFAQAEIQNPQGGTFWKLKGNEGTSATTNFIGTIDNVALSFRLNNQWAGRLDHINNNYSIGPFSLSLNPTGIRNIAIGNAALYRTSTGVQNVAYGNFVLLNTTTGSYNTALGDDAANRNITGTGNTAIGQAALYRDTLGNNNVALGRLSLSNNFIGSNNTALGTEAGVNNNGSGNIFIGRQAGANEPGSNKLYIDNSNTVNPLLYGDFATDLLRVNGTLNINNAYSMPTADGAANYVLATNGAGVADWFDITALTNSWSLTGNSGTNAATNFIGTTDNTPVSFRLNNQWAGRLDHLNNNYSIGPLALVSSPTGTRNIAFGNWALRRTTTGTQNVAYGNFTSVSTTTGSYNTAVGDDAANRNITGTGNTAIGQAALYNDTLGNNNVAIGRLTLYNNFSGTNNTALGTEAGVNNNGSSNIFIGRQAGANETGSNKLYIDNSNTASPLIFGDFVTNLLRVNGTLNINNAYSMPTTDGVANYVLATNGAGVADWSDITALTNAWSLTGNSGTNAATNFIGTTDNQPLVFKLNNQWAGIYDITTNSYGIGLNALALNTGAGNVAVGNNSMAFNNSGTNNSAIGQNALYSNSSGSFNVAVGQGAGYSTTGNSNVFLGYQAGYNETGSNKLYIDNTNTASPLLFGDFNTNIVQVNGKLGVGVSPTRELDVTGDIDASNNVYAGTTSTFGAMTFGAANATAGTIGSSGFSRLTNGMILQWATMQLTDNSGATAYTWTFPTAFPGGVMSVTATNASRAGGQTSANAASAIPVVGTTSATSAQLFLRNTGLPGTQCWVTLMAIGW